MCVTCQMSINYCRIVSSVVVVAVVTKICIKFNDIDIDNDNESVTSIKCRQKLYKVSICTHWSHTCIYKVYMHIASCTWLLILLFESWTWNAWNAVKIFSFIWIAVRNSVWWLIFFYDIYIAKTPCKRKPCSPFLLLFLRPSPNCGQCKNKNVYMFCNFCIRFGKTMDFCTQRRQGGGR